MRMDDPNIRDIKTNYDGRNNFIANIGENRKTKAIDMLKTLDADGKRVFVTDPYLFNPSDGTYEQDLIDILVSMNAKEIIYCAPAIQSQPMFNNVRSALSAANCALNHNTGFTVCHDRFWYCPESDQAVVFGTSLNGLCKKLCYVNPLDPQDVASLKNEFIACGLL